MSPLNHTAEWLQEEGDSVRTFYTHIAHPIQVAFQTQHGTPFIVLRSEPGPLGTTHVRQTVDFTWAFQDHALLIGEHKMHGIIDTARWIGQAQPDSNRRLLGQELRGQSSSAIAHCSDGCLLTGTLSDTTINTNALLHRHLTEGTSSFWYSTPGRLMRSSNRTIESQASFSQVHVRRCAMASFAW